MSAKIENENATHFSHVDPDEFIRGETPVNIEEKCLKLCQSYIGSRWNDAQLSDICVKRLSGGITNQLYRVQLLFNDIVDNNHKDDSMENQFDVVVKLYQSKKLRSFHPEDSERLNDNIILTILSHLKLSPHVYGIFDEGNIQAYIKHQRFDVEHQQNSKLVSEIAVLLAKLHSLKLPIRKCFDWKLKQGGEMLEQVFQRDKTKQYFVENKLKNLIKYNIQEEFKLMERIIENLNFPLVLCHNDFLGSNIMITNSKIFLIDLEFCTYGSRGNDIGLFHTQWGVSPNDFDNFGMPDDLVMEQFIAQYREAFDKIDPGYLNRKENCPKSILRETKICLLYNFLFWTVFFLFENETIIKGLPFDRKRNYVS
ncbi:hypothetical protein RDWZM_006241 [Blomia tropicalis]|uniref:ethanolamine kinase n=1 Tax=Blomia tropicalis TaxID=40697 RepID=A0A9Q0M7K8_BLOTA|nr:hypothetical protein RDWZM_006241 [Blomia tropicalis]